MKLAILPFALCILFLSCKKEIKELEVVIPAPITTAPYIKVDQVINDSTIVLKWSKFVGTNFQKYLLVRTATFLKNNEFGVFAEIIDSSRDVNHLSFTDYKMPLAKDVYYDIYVFKDSVPQGPYMQPVARVYYERLKGILYGTPFDVLINKQEQKLYITELNKITITDYSGRNIASQSFPVTIGFCSLGDFNGSKELYVPMSDGWLQILDAATLQLKDKIYVAGYEIGSVLSVSGKLYVSSSDQSVGGYSDCIKVYDRATKIMIGRTGYSDRTRLLLLEGTDVEMIDLTLSVIPIGLCYYQFSAVGEPLAKKEDSYHGDFPVNPYIVRSFPDGSKFITSSSGTIFNKSLVFDRYLKQYGSYSDFAFNSDGSLIYAANTSQKKIDVVTYPATTTISSYNTNFYPYKIFRDGNTLICLSKTNINQQASYLFVEKINL